jgi:uncharacterized protein
MLRFEWDENKNQSNSEKHGIDFNTASRVFDDERVVLFIEPVVQAEQRWQAIGCVPGTMLILVVVHTYREQGSEQVARIISARRADRRERKIYDEQNA